MPKSRTRTVSGTRSRTAPVVSMVHAIDSHPARQAIAARAYELFLRRGATHGHDRADWLAAERELAGSLREPTTEPLDYAG